MNAHEKPFFRTAEAFNAASNDADWGYHIENEGGTWKVLDREGLVKMWSNDEVMLSGLAPHLVTGENEIAKRTFSRPDRHQWLRQISGLWLGCARPG